MADEEVWRSSEVDEAVGGGVGDGVPTNLAFSIDVVLKNGMALLTEQPGYAMAAGGLVFVSQVGPALLSIPFSLGIIGTVDDPEVANAVQQGANAIISLIALPFQQVFIAGMIGGLARYAATDDANWRVLFTSVLPAVRAFLYQLLVGLVNLAMIVVFSIPTGIAAAIAVSQGLDWQMPVIVGIVSAIVFLPVFIYVALGLQLGMFSAIIDGKWPVEAIAASWQAAEGARLTLFITNFLFGILLFISYLMVYCLIGLALFPAVNVIYWGGLAVSWLMHARNEDNVRSFAFFNRNPLPF